MKTLLKVNSEAAKLEVNLLADGRREKIYVEFDDSTTVEETISNAVSMINMKENIFRK